MNDTNTRIVAAIKQTTGLDFSTWIGQLKEQSGKLHGPYDFPLHSIFECSSIEHCLRSNHAGELDTIRFYQLIASGCLTTAFIMTQRDAARRRIVSSPNADLASLARHAMDQRQTFATVAISHLTTSRRFLSQPPLRAIRQKDGWLLEGYAPWVTGARFADWIVVGAMCDSDASAPPEPNLLAKMELLALVPTNSDGITVEPGEDLIGLSASSTGMVRFNQVQVDDARVLHGPVVNVMSVSSGHGGAGGLQTSALAMGHGSQAIDYLKEEAKRRPDLDSIVHRFELQLSLLNNALVKAAEGAPGTDAGELRKSANDFVLNATHAAMVAAKGAGFVSKHPVGRWCREALFFLVWSCPPNVAQSHLCSWAC